MWYELFALPLYILNINHQVSTKEKIPVMRTQATNQPGDPGRGEQDALLMRRKWRFGEVMGEKCWMSFWPPILITNQDPMNAAVIAALQP